MKSEKEEFKLKLYFGENKLTNYEKYSIHLRVKLITHVVGTCYCQVDNMKITENGI